ncbi:hypothetical protein DL96DRAFT_1608388 [Flagelloscypha sp. PMI_526]|nr:hypothetical protein DL96DRAFT_1608388 [Flagelloscypha sp. PMI_526]
MSTLLPQLPTEVVEDIIISCADSDTESACTLCLVSRAFYQSSIRRLYNTLSINRERDLADMLSFSALGQPWVASSVRVLMLTYTPPSATFSQNLLFQAFSVLDGLCSLQLPVYTPLDPSWRLPKLAHLSAWNIAHKGLSASNFRGITRLHLDDHLLHAISMLRMASVKPVHLTHLFLSDQSDHLDSRLLSSIELQLPSLLDESPSIRIFVLRCQDMAYLPPKPPPVDFSELLRKASELIQAHPHVVFMNWRFGDASPPNGWIGPRLFNHSRDNMVTECLLAHPKDNEGFWEKAEEHIRKFQTGPQAIEDFNNESLPRIVL